MQKEHGKVQMFSITPDMEILGFTLGYKFLSYSGYPNQGRIKIENTHVFDVHSNQSRIKIENIHVFDVQ